MASVWAVTRTPWWRHIWPLVGLTAWTDEASLWDTCCSSFVLLGRHINLELASTFCEPSALATSRSQVRVQVAVTPRRPRVVVTFCRISLEAARRCLYFSSINIYYYYACSSVSVIHVWGKLGWSGRIILLRRERILQGLG